MQTKWKLLKQLQEHLNDIRKNHQYDPIGYHFNITGHSGDIKQITTYILAFVTLPGDTNGALQMHLKFERHWIFKLRTLLPHGLKSTDSLEILAFPSPTKYKPSQ